MNLCVLCHLSLRSKSIDSQLDSIAGFKVLGWIESKSYAGRSTGADDVAGQEGHELA